MQIIYSITGSKRKELVSAVSQELNAPVKYLGMPFMPRKLFCKVNAEKSLLMENRPNSLCIIYLAF